MNEYTPEKVAELVAVAETWVPNECAASPVGAWHTIERLTDALTAVSAERDRLDESFDRDLPWRYREVLEQVKTMRQERERAEFYKERAGEFRRKSCTLDYDLARAQEVIASAEQRYADSRKQQYRGFEVAQDMHNVLATYDRENGTDDVR